MRLGWTFVDADDHHPAENIERMRAGLPLTERLREPWLARLSVLIRQWLAQADNPGAIDKARGRGVRDAGARPATTTGTVLACSALRRAHRKTLASGRDEVWFAFLDVSPDHLKSRLTTRTGHFMHAALLDSQLRTLEPPGPDEPVWIIPGNGTIEETVNLVLARLRQG